MVCRVTHHQLLPTGVLQGVVEYAVMLAHSVAAKSFGQLAVEVLLDLGGSQLRQTDAAQRRGEVVTHDHAVAMYCAGGSAGGDDLFQPVSQPLADCQSLRPSAPGKDAVCVVAIQGLDGQLQRWIASGRPPGPAAPLGLEAHGDIVTAALVVVGNVGQDVFS